ncbi:unnamed protein product, partial [Ixodes pacificus]
RFRTHTAPQNVKRFRPTIPVTPHLATKLRSRPVKIETKAERDQRLAEELKKYRVRPSKVAPPRKAPRKEAEVVAGPSGRGESQCQASAPTADRRKTHVLSAAAEPGRKFVARPPPKTALAGPTPQHFKAKPAPPALRVFRPRCQSAPVKQMNQQLVNLSKFVAKPCPTSRPFTAKLEQKHTVPDKVQLHSTTRAQQRHDFDSALSSRIHKRAAESEERKRAEEEAAIRELRRKTVFRANPVPRPKPPAARAAKRAAPRATNSASSSPRARKPRRSPRNPTPGMK